jgi:transcription elongation factor Elf1
MLACVQLQRFIGYNYLDCLVMGRRKRKKITYRPAKVLPKIFVCPSCGHKTMKTKLKHKDDKAIVQCGHCGIAQEVPKTEISEPVDAFGEFIDIYFKDQEYARLSLRVEKLVNKGQYTELVNVYSLLADIATINQQKALEEYESTRDPEDLETAERWKAEVDQYKENESSLKQKLQNGEVQDAPLEEQVYEEKEDNPFEEGEAKVSEKPKRKVNIDDFLGDTGFLEF